jgi:hypothetical protein
MTNLVNVGNYSDIAAGLGFRYHPMAAKAAKKQEQFASARLCSLQHEAREAILALQRGVLEAQKAWYEKRFRSLARVDTGVRAQLIKELSDLYADANKRVKSAVANDNLKVRRLVGQEQMERLLSKLEVGALALALARFLTPLAPCHRDLPSSEPPRRRRMTRPWRCRLKKPPLKKPPLKKPKKPSASGTCSLRVSVRTRACAL